MSYLEDIFKNNIVKDDVKVIFELGSRDLIDAYKLYNYYNAKVYAFECNPDCISECEKNYNNFNLFTKHNITLVKHAVAETNGPITFYPFDLKKYNNMGASSLLKIDFSKRDKHDPDYNIPNPQKEISVYGIRIDTFMLEHDIKNIDLLCIDLQGYELNALKSMGNALHNVKYIITECSVKNTYINGATFTELKEYLKQFNFKYKCSNNFEYDDPDLDLNGYSEFDALFVKN
jgi:FkbM family methyltransferase